MNPNKLELIFDTDFGSDCNDAMALVYLIYAKHHLNVDIKAVTHSQSTPYGIPALRSFFRFFGEEVPEVGKMIGGPMLNHKDRYCKELAQKFAIEGDYADAPPAATVLRRALASAENKCIICAVGHFTNIAALLESEPDEISPLSGVELVAEKCSRFVIMAAKFVDEEDGSRTQDWNIKWDVPATRAFFELSPVPVYVLPSETGRDVFTGEYHLKKYGGENPLTLSFLSWLKEIKGRPSWDPMTAIYAVEGKREFFSESAKGNITVTDNGTTYFEASSGGKFVILSKNSDVQGVVGKIEKYIDECAEVVIYHALERV